MSKPDPHFEEARDLLRQDQATFDVEQQTGWSMDLQRVAIQLLEKTDISAWGEKQSNLKSAAEMARALSKIHLADHLARLMAAGTAVNAEPDSEQEKEMVALFDSLSSQTPFFDARRQTVLAQDCISALGNVYAYHNQKTKDPSRAKIPQPGDHGYNMRKAAIALFFQGAPLDDPENLIRSYAVVAECSPPDSPERLAAVLGLLRYPQYAGYLEGADAEGYIENLAPIGSLIRHEAEELLKTDATFPLKDLFDYAREKKAELKKE